MSGSFYDFAHIFFYFEMVALLFIAITSAFPGFEGYISRGCAKVMALVRNRETKDRETKKV